MKSWVTPEARVEKFISNEYVAACWGVVCTVPAESGTGSANDPIVKNDPHVSHRAAFCGDPTHYQIGVDENGTAVDMIEINTDGMGSLPCTAYLDAAYTAVRPISSVENGDYLYWTTSFNGTTWYHHGTVTGTTNHS